MDTEQEDYEDITDEEEIIPEQTQRQAKKVVNKGRGNKQRNMKTKTEVPAENLPESRYVKYRVQSQEGVMDTETGKPVGNEVYVILAEILNKLNNIEISQG